MLEKPALPEAEIIDCLQADYGLHVVQVEFLPIGADSNSALYRALSSNGVAYFVKLRSGEFNALTVMAPKFLHEQGCQQIIPPSLTRSHHLWTTLRHFTLTLCPYVSGHDGYEVMLSAEQWRELGRVLKQIHTTIVPAEWEAHIPRESYSAQWRKEVVHFQAMADNTLFPDPIAAELAALLRQQRPVIDALVTRAEHLAAVLGRPKSSPLPPVLCHGDLHAGNVLLADDGHLYIVDWDTLIWAPKERDLMFVGGGQFANHRSPQVEEELFYQGYGPTTPTVVNPVALAYYRYERIVQDIAAYCEQILLSGEGSEDREAGLRQLAAQFLPNGVVDIAFHSEAESLLTSYIVPLNIDNP